MKHIIHTNIYFNDDVQRYVKIYSVHKKNMQ